MKLIFFSIMMFFAFCTIDAQQVPIYKQAYKKLSLFNGDTTAYLKYNFIDNKELFIDKHFSEVLKKLEIKIKEYFSSCLVYNKHLIYVTSFQLDDNITSSLKRSKGTAPHNLIIYWKPYLPAKIVDSLWKATNYKWTKAVEIFYGQQKISDIDKSDYSKHKEKEDPPIDAEGVGYNSKTGTKNQKWF